MKNKKIFLMAMLSFLVVIGMLSNAYADVIQPDTVNSVPEPATMLLLGSGLIGLAAFGRKRFKKK